MKYPFLTLLEIISIILALFIAVVVFYFLARIFKKIKFFEAAKSIGIYWLVSLIIYLIYPFSLFRRSMVIYIAGIIIFAALLFSAFYLIPKKNLSITFKRSLILFLLVVIVAFPVISWLRGVVIYQGLIKIPVFAKEFDELTSTGFTFSLYNPTFFSSPYPYKITDVIERATLSWPADEIRKLVVIWPE